MDIASQFGIDWRLLALQIVNFGLLLFVLHRFLFKPIVGMLEKRREMIASSVVRAKETEERAHAAAEEKAKILLEARQNANAILTDAAERGKVHADAILAKAGEEAQQILVRARAESEKELARALHEARQKSAILVVQATEKILKAKLDSAKDMEMVRDAIEHIPYSHEA